MSSCTHVPQRFPKTPEFSCVWILQGSPESAEARWRTVRGRHFTRVSAIACHAFWRSVPLPANLLPPQRSSTPSFLTRTTVTPQRGAEPYLDNYKLCIDRDLRSAGFGSVRRNSAIKGRADVWACQDPAQMVRGHNDIHGCGGRRFRASTPHSDFVLGPPIRPDPARRANFGARRHDTRARVHVLTTQVEGHSLSV